MPKEDAGFFGKVYAWTTTLDEERPSSDHTLSPLPQMAMIKDHECQPGLHYVLIIDSDAMAEIFGNSNFTARYSSALGWGLVVALRGQPTYNERCWLFTLSQRYDQAIFAEMIDLDPYSMDIYTILGTGSPHFLPEDRHIATNRLHYIRPTYKELNPNNGEFRDPDNNGMIVLVSLIAYRRPPRESKPELKIMKKNKNHAEVDTHEDIIGLPARSLLGLKRSSTLFPESSDSGALHTLEPKHKEDFKLDLEPVVPADLQFHKDESGMMTLVHTNTDGCKTILKRSGNKSPISKFSANGRVGYHIVSTLTFAQQILKPKRERLTAKILNMCKAPRDFSSINGYS
ncbi:unnamed protein product [Rhizoctonia solani]|uniref:Topoisomerase 6 subunit A/Spo11 TOPRIM domain-containing protein n=1 Tax=Rhizoctonia solani TaxID=456999 RepID=A0A8H3A6Z2_9AGAM|nr:unnamed protein product [Rhizoctonia solani]